jgi:chromosome segregation ATPase
VSDIEEFQKRIIGALDRAGQALDSLNGSANDGVDSQALSAELEAERMANAQLEERVRAIKEKQETMVTRLEAEVTKLRGALETRDGEVQRMRSVNDELRASNRALREANAAGLAEPHLVNSAMMSELEALRERRAADRAELDEVLATLEPALKEA